MADLLTDTPSFVRVPGDRLYGAFCDFVLSDPNDVEGIERALETMTEAMRQSVAMLDSKGMQLGHVLVCAFPLKPDERKQATHRAAWRVQVVPQGQGEQGVAGQD